MTSIAAGVTVPFDGDVWRIRATGGVRDGKVVCRLVSTTQTRAVRAGRMGSRRVPRRCLVPLDVAVVASALDRPDGWFSWNPALRGAFARGEATQARGGSMDECPYVDRRNGHGGLTWSRAFESAWRDGFEHARRVAVRGPGRRE